MIDIEWSRLVAFDQRKRGYDFSSSERGASKVSRKDISLFQSAIPSHPLNFAGLSSFCNDVNAINEEFAGIPQVSGKIDELPPGAEVKNRYANVIPLPETRVQLQKLNNDASTEYINASYVRVRSLDWNWFSEYAPESRFFFHFPQFSSIS